MKTIIIPTDFSSAADNAMHYGAQLAQHLQAQLLLLHVYMVPITMNDMPVLMVTAEELKGGAEEGLMRCKSELEAAYPGLSIKTESRLGDVVDELKDMCEHLNPQLVVMGTHGSSGLERILFGSNAVSAIKNIKHPVIVVPAQFPYKKIETIVLAADLNAANETAKFRLLQTLQLLKAQLHIVHVTTEDELENIQPAIVQQLQSLSPVYNTIESKDISLGLQQYIEQVGADMLVVLPHEHSMLESFFLKMHTKDIVRHAQVPVLTLHS
ncbi:MAG: universal stress protein [Chitinophagaceae bacterium]